MTLPEAVGYTDPAYPASLAEFGTPSRLHHSGGWILKRPIPGSPYQDGIGCYPLFVCNHWNQLDSDLSELKDELVSLTIVADPFGEYDSGLLKRCFKDVVYPFKQHFVIDLKRPAVSKHHRNLALKALKSIEVEACQEPHRFLDEWTGLYAHLTERHDIKGIRAFSKKSFSQLLNMPGVVVLRAMHKGVVVGAQLYLSQGDVVHCHLGAVSDMGYKIGAFYALEWASLDHFSGRARWLNLGGGLGCSVDKNDGLSRYKKGWATETRTAYLCGRIFDHEKYHKIVADRNIGETDYFPAYRNGEFFSSCRDEL